MRGSLLVPLGMIVIAAASTAGLLRDEAIRYAHRTPSIVGVPDLGLTTLRRIIPQGETLGFITDRNQPEAVAHRLYGLNYSLAPLIVENTANRRFVLGDFRDQSSIPFALEQHRLRVVVAAGNGILLLEAR